MPLGEAAPARMRERDPIVPPFWVSYMGYRSRLPQSIRPCRTPRVACSRHGPSCEKPSDVRRDRPPTAAGVARRSCLTAAPAAKHGARVERLGAAHALAAPSAPAARIAPCGEARWALYNRVSSTEAVDARDDPEPPELYRPAPRF